MDKETMEKFSELFKAIHSLRTELMKFGYDYKYLTIRKGDNIYTETQFPEMLCGLHILDSKLRTGHMESIKDDVGFPMGHMFVYDDMVNTVVDVGCVGGDNTAEVKYKFNNGDIKVMSVKINKPEDNRDQAAWNRRHEWYRRILQETWDKYCKEHGHEIYHDCVKGDDFCRKCGKRGTWDELRNFSK